MVSVSRSTGMKFFYSGGNLLKGGWKVSCAYASLMGLDPNPLISCSSASASSTLMMIGWTLCSLDPVGIWFMKCMNSIFFFAMNYLLPVLV
jgi:hypothetical protein